MPMLSCSFLKLSGCSFKLIMLVSKNGNLMLYELLDLNFKWYNIAPGANIMEIFWLTKKYWMAIICVASRVLISQISLGYWILIIFIIASLEEAVTLHEHNFDCRGYCMCLLKLNMGDWILSCPLSVDV